MEPILLGRSKSLPFQIQFARANALAGYKNKAIEDIAAVGGATKIEFPALADCAQSAKIIAHIHHEMALHIDYCQGFGITKGEIEKSEESEGMLLL
jgi:hypothetical protein